MSGNDVKHSDFDEVDYKRAVPEIHDWLRMRNLTGWLFGFVERYFMSRNYPAMLMAAPFLMLGIGGPAFLWWLKEAPRTDTVELYAAAAEEAKQNNDPEAAGLFLGSLVRLRPADKKYRFDYAMHLIENDQVDEGLKCLKPITSVGPTGYNSARMWLASQRLAEEPLAKVSEEEYENLLLAVTRDSRTNLPANQMLADLYLKTGKLKAAEDRLEMIVERIPALNYSLVVVKKRLGRKKDQFGIYLQNGMRFFRDRLVEDPADVEARIVLAKCFAIDDKYEEAARLLSEGIGGEDSPELRFALSDMLVEFANKRLQISPANRDQAANKYAQALQFRPGSADIVMNLIRLQEQGAEIPENIFDSSIKEMTEKAERTEREELALSRMLTITKKYDEAVEVLAQTKHTSLQVDLLRATALQAAGRAKEADEQIDRLLADFSARKDSLSPIEVAAYSNAFSLKKDYENAHRVVKEAIPRVMQSYDVESMQPDERRQASLETRAMQLALGQACVDRYRQLLSDKDFDDAELAMKLLTEALATNTAGYMVIDLLADQVITNGRFVDESDKLLNRLLANGVANADIYHMLGMKALIANNCSRAKVYLNRSVSLNGSNPIVLNNLALAIVRDESVSKDDAQDALRLANQVLEILPGNADGLSTRGEVLIALERWEEARADLESSIRGKKSNITTRELLIRVFEALDEPGLAAEHGRILGELRAAQEGDGTTESES